MNPEQFQPNFNVNSSPQEIRNVCIDAENLVSDQGPVGEYIEEACKYLRRAVEWAYAAASIQKYYVFLHEDGECLLLIPQEVLRECTPTAVQGIADAVAAANGGGSGKYFRGSSLVGADRDAAAQWLVDNRCVNYSYGG